MENTELFGEAHEQEENGLFGKRHQAEQLNLCEVIRQSGQLVCEHPIEKRASFKSHGKEFCWKCGKHI
tara:strand:- start:1177 stop:1380 length:204 start_codon:yes stop_codon:yes gene_type:complete